MPKTLITTTTQQVIDYLKQHPSFFRENEALLCDLDWGGLGDEHAIPFYERQIKALKERENQRKTTIDAIVDSAKNNQRLESDLLNMAVHLLGHREHKKEATATVSALVKRQFDMDDVVVLLDNDAHRHSRYDDVRQRVAHHSSICDDRVSSHLLAALFSGDDKAIKSIQSCAFVPLIFADEINGVMVLGSSSKTRFQLGVGVVFLDRLGLLLGGYFQDNK